MALNLEAKKAIVAETTKIAENSALIIAADYRGLTVAQMTDLRCKARDAGLTLRVIRNTLARRALQDTSYACLQEALVGPMVMLFSPEDPGIAARIVRDFAKDNELLEVKALALTGQLLDASQLMAVASLPSREEALASVAAVLQAPMTKFVRTLAEPLASLGRVMAQVRDQKQ